MKSFSANSDSKISIFVNGSFPEILTSSETWLNENSLENIRGCASFHITRKHRRSVGISMFVKQDIHIHLVSIYNRIYYIYIWYLLSKYLTSVFQTIQLKYVQLKPNLLTVHTGFFFEILLNQPDIRLYSPFSNWSEIKRTSVWFQMNRKMVNKIWFLVDSIRFRKDFSVCILTAILASGQYSKTILSEYNAALCNIVYCVW